MTGLFRNARRFRPLLAAAMLLAAVSQLGAADRLFWEFPEPVGRADGGRFPTLVETGGGMALVWQEFLGETGSFESTISIRALFSEDGTDWNSEPVTVAENIPYLWMEEVPLFSAVTDDKGGLVVAVSEGLEGIAVYGPSSAAGTGYSRRALIASGPDEADTAVAPGLVRTPDGGFLLLLTRRTAVEGASRPTTLTIFSSRSDDGFSWSAPSLLVDPAADRGAVDSLGNRGVLEQNFLPTHLSARGREYLAFQSLRQGEQGQVYQIYLKYRESGGSWGAAVPVTEELNTSGGENDPLSWDNQRPRLDVSAEGEIILTWERRRPGDRPGIAAAVIGRDGTVESDTVEDVVQDRYTSAFPRILDIDGGTWVLWFDDTGIRLAQRNGAYNYSVQAASLDADTPGADRGSAAFPRAVRFRNNTYVLWQDRAGGLERSVFLRPDLTVDPPALRDASFTGGRPGNRTTLVVDWSGPVDSSGVLSHSWRWSRSPSATPSRAEIDQVYGQNRAVYEIPDPEESEGNWYFSLVARDQAGNWSDPLRLAYTLDMTPPPPPIVNAPATDAYGYLRSNTFLLEWEDAEADAAEYYRWRMDYLGASPESMDFSTLEARRVAAGADGATETSRSSVSWENLDNGVWAFSVASVDRAGNVSPSSTKILLTRRYIPVTFITGVTVRKDEADRQVLQIIGRGFAVGGLLTHGIIDEDGEEPWDYAYTAESGQLKVLSDRIAEITGIEAMDAGTYRIGVRHPVRGTVYWNRLMKLDATGNVKFGPFGLYAYESLWEPAALSVRLSGNAFLVLMIVLLVLAAVIIAVIRLFAAAREAKVLKDNARAILSRGPMSAAAREEAAALLRRKGMGLRRKFTMAFTTLVVITILLIAAVLGFVWIRMERDTLAEGLESESRLLVETLSSSAVNSIPAADRGALLLLPDRISALPDALWTTVTGPRSALVNGVLRATGEGSEYIWASNDPGILDRIRLPRNLDAASLDLAADAADTEEDALLERFYPRTADSGVLADGNMTPEERRTLAGILRRVNLMPLDIELGVSVIDDELSADIELMRQEVEQAAQDAGIAGMIAELDILEEQYAALAGEVVLTLDFDNPEYVEAESAVAAQKKEIETLLLEISNAHFASYPEFNAESMRAGGPDFFIFYKPLLYRIGDQDTSFFRGTVRLAVTVDDIRNSLTRVQRRILIITVLASAAALAAGILLALFISSLIVRPITALVRSVEVIREQPDMLEHEGFDVGIDTGDELSILGESINGMVHGLVQAAIEQKELIAGQEIQKTFLPLESDEKSGKKLSTGGAKNAFFRLFGYYEGADAVSGDYFDFRQLDDDHYVMIKLDIAGHGVTASLIMVQVAALYVDYFRRVRDRAAETGRLDYNLREFTFGINDLINEVGFKGRFAAFNLSVMNVRTARYEMIHAGDNLVHIFDGKTRKMKLIELPESPATGQIESFMIEMNPTMYKEVDGHLERGDILFLYTDGIEEAHHIIRDGDFKVVEYQDLSEETKQKDAKFVEAGYKPMDETQDNEEFDPVRIDAVIEAAMNRGRYVLERRCDLTIGKPLHFDFTDLEGTAEDAVLALASVEKVFRIIPDDSGGSAGRVRVDRKIVAFLEKHFAEFKEFYNNPQDEDAGYIWYSHLREDPQDDDLTIWAYERL